MRALGRANNFPDSASLHPGYLLPRCGLPAQPTATSSALTRSGDFHASLESFMRTRSLMRLLSILCVSPALAAPAAFAAQAAAMPRPQFGSDRVLPAASLIDADQYTAQALAMPTKAFSGNASAVNIDNVAVGWYQTRNGSFAVSWDPA